MIVEEEPKNELTKVTKHTNEIEEKMPENLIDDIKKLTPQSYDLVKNVSLCINNAQTSFFIKDAKKTETFYECTNPKCLDISYMCAECARTCHSHCPMENKQIKEVVRKNVKCGCALKNHQFKGKGAYDAYMTNNRFLRMSTLDLSEKFPKFLENLNFRYWALRKQGSEYVEEGIRNLIEINNEKSGENLNLHQELLFDQKEETTEDWILQHKPKNTHICIYCYKNCFKKTKSNFVLEEIENQQSLECNCCVENKHDPSFMKRKVLNYIVDLNDQTDIKFDKFLLIGKVFFNDTMFKREFQEFNDTNDRIMNATKNPLSVKFTNSYLLVVEFMVNFTDKTKQVVFDLSELEQYQLKSFNFDFLLKVTDSIAATPLEDSSDFASVMLPKMLYYFRYYYIYPKTRIKNIKLISKHRENISPLHRYFFKDHLDEFYKLTGIEKKKFNQFMENLYKIIKNMLKRGVDTNNFAELIRQYLQFIELQLCYRMDIDFFSQICIKILGILKYYKSNSIFQYSKHEDTGENFDENQTDETEDELSQKKKVASLRKLNRDIRRMTTLLMIGLNDIEFEKRVFLHKKSIDHKGGFIFQIGEIQKIILQIVFYSEKKNFSGLYIYHMMLMKTDSYIDNIRYLLNSKENIFEEKFLPIYMHQFSPNLFAEKNFTKCDDLFKNYEEIKRGYILGLKGAKSLDPLVSMKIFAEERAKEIKALLNLTSKDDKYAKQLYLMKNGYMEILFDMFKIVSKNKFFTTSDTQKATVNDIIKIILAKILPSLVEGNAFLASVFFSIKIVHMFFTKDNKEFLFDILEFYSLLLSSISQAKIKINVKFILEKITKKASDGILTKKPFRFNNNPEFETITVSDIKKEFDNGKDQKSFEEKLKTIFQAYHELLCVASDHVEIYINDLMVQVVKNILKDNNIKEIFSRYLNQLIERRPESSLRSSGGKKAEGFCEQVTLKIFQIINTISNNYFYLINEFIPTETLEQFLVLYDQLNPNARMIIQELYIRHKMKFPYKITYDWRTTFEKMLNGDEKCLLLHKNEPRQAPLKDYNDDFKNVEEGYTEYEIVKRILNNFKKMVNSYGKDYFKNNPEFLLNFFENVVLATSLFTLYKIIYFNREINNIHKYYIYSICYLFLECLRYMLWNFLEKPKSDMEAYTIIFLRYFKIPDQKDTNDDEDLRLFFETLYQQVEIQIKKINAQNKYLDHQQFIEIFSKFASMFKFYEKQNDSTYSGPHIGISRFHNKFYKSVSEFYTTYNTRKGDKSKNIMHAILNKKNDDELYQTLKIKIVDDLIDKLRSYAYRKTLKSKSEESNYLIGTGLRDIFMIVEKTMAIAPEAYQKKILDRTSNSDLVKNEFVSLINNKIPYLMQYIALEFSNNKLVSNGPFIKLFKDMLNLLENICEKNEVLTIFVAKCKVDEKSPFKFEDLLMNFLSLIVVNLRYYDKKKSMLELLNKKPETKDNEKESNTHKSNFFNPFIKKIFHLVCKLVRESKIPLYKNIDSDDKKCLLSPVFGFNFLKEQSIELLRNVERNTTFSYYIYHFILFLDVISFEYDAEYDMKIREVQSVLMYCFNKLLDRHVKNKNDPKTPLALDLFEEVKKNPEILQEEIFVILSKVYIFVHNVAELKRPASQKFSKFLDNLKEYSVKKYDKDAEGKYKDEDKVKMTLGQIYLFFKGLIKNVEIVYTKNNVAEKAPFNISGDSRDIILNKLTQHLLLDESEIQSLKSVQDTQRREEEMQTPIQIYFVAHYDGLCLDENSTIANFLAICKFHEGSNQKLLYLLDYYAFLNTKVKMAKEYAKHNEKFKALQLIKESTPLEQISAVFTVLTNVSVLLSIYYYNPLFSMTRELVNPFYYFTMIINAVHLLFLGFCIGVMSYKERITYNFFLDQNKNTDLDFFKNFANTQIYPLAWNFLFGFIGCLHQKLNFLFSLQMFSLFYLFGTMKAAIYSVQSKYSQFLSAGFLILIFIIFYSFISVMFFRDKFFSSDLQENVCDTVFQCIISLLSNGVRSGAGLGFSLVPTTDPNYWTGFIFEWVFYFSIILVMLNIINGIIVDTFQSMRKTNEINEKKRDYLCYICSISRTVFEAHGKVFKTHCRVDHNIFNYMQFILKVKNSEESVLNSAEIYVKKKIDKARTDFFPIKKSRNLKN